MSRRGPKNIFYGGHKSYLKLYFTPLQFNFHCFNFTAALENAIQAAVAQMILLKLIYSRHKKCFLAAAAQNDTIEN